VTETLAVFPGGIEPHAWHHLRLVKRGAGVWVEWDGRALTDRPVYLPRASRGHVGVVGWRAQPAAEVRLARVALSRFHFDVRPVSAQPTREDVQALIRDARSIAAVSPPAGMVRGNEFLEVGFDHELFSILSRRYGWEVVPTIRLAPSQRVDQIGASGGTPRSTAGGWAADLVARVEERGWGGLRVDATGLSASDRRALDAAVGLVERRLRGQERRFLPAADEGRESALLHRFDANL
jgi:hypothetical protein